ncbi:MAG: UDP-N-acetylmuramate--L-alanine ligase [Acidothermus sp.]|nr:UDP-N-acetylmuramate--L-alanine ligase [Acidothermus sp.]
MTVPGLEELGRIHMIGIGGGGMSGIARILLARGAAVSGCDARDARVLAALRAVGASVDVGHDPAHVAALGPGDTVVVSTAVPPSNPEVKAARERGCRVLPRAAALAAVMAGSRGIAVAGTHGKTTTTSMIVRMLQRCGADPSFAIGADLGEPGSNGHAGTGPFFVAEADESDASFLLLPFEVAVVTNIEADHLNHFPDLDAIRDAFDHFAAKIPVDGFLVACADDPGAAWLARRARERGTAVRCYGSGEHADVRIEEVEVAGLGSRFRVAADGESLGEVRLRVPGTHNVQNAAAAIAVGLGLGLPLAEIVAGLGEFTGARRRFEPQGEVGGIRVFDDYAHHPTEIAATLRAARVVADGGRLVVAFQPHHYYRTAAFRREFGEALALADEVVVMEVYAPGETPLPDGTGTALAAAVPLPPSRVVFEPSWSAVPAQLVDRARPGDLIVTMGAGGDVALLPPLVLDALRQRWG